MDDLTTQPCCITNTIASKSEVSWADYHYLERALRSGKQIMLFLISCWLLLLFNHPHGWHSLDMDGWCFPNPYFQGPTSGPYVVTTAARSIFRLHSYMRVMTDMSPCVAQCMQMSGTAILVCHALRYTICHTPCRYVIIWHRCTIVHCTVYFTSAWKSVYYVHPM